MKRALLLYPLILITLFSCVTPKKTHYLQDTSNSIASYPEFYTPIDYIIRKSDELDIRVVTLDPESNKVFNSSEEGSRTQYTSYKGLYTYTVYEDGTIDFPYVGAIAVAGKTNREVKRILEGALKDYVKDCSVQVRLSNCYFNLLTEKGAGRYQILKEKMTIFEALAVAGDLGEYSDRSKVKLLRLDPEGATVTKEFDLRSKDIIGSEFYYIQPNDIIYVKAFNGQFFRSKNFLTTLGVATTTVSFGLLIWQIVDLCINAAAK